MEIPIEIQNFIKFPLIERRAQFITWVASKSPMEDFEFFSINRCALAQFGQSLCPRIAKNIQGGSDSFYIYEDDGLFGFDGQDEVQVQVLLEDDKICDCKTFGELHSLFS